MIKMPWKIEKTPPSTAEKRLKEISDILFPPLETKEELDKQGVPTRFHVDYSVDSNIDAALHDLYEGHNDDVVRTTLSKAASRLNQVRKLLEAYPIIDDDIKYIIVDSGKEEDVEAADD